MSECIIPASMYERSDRGIKRRRVQAERSAETRRLLLEATIQSLVENGYTRTTTAEIAERAGFTRGAQLHHFKNKEDLVFGAVEHLLGRAFNEFPRAFEKSAARTNPNETTVDLIWSIVGAPWFHAWLELQMAARTDDRLRHTMEKVGREADRRTLELAATLAPLGLAELRLYLSLIFCLMYGMAVYSPPNEPREERETVRVADQQLLGLLKDILKLLMSSPRLLRKHTRSVPAKADRRQ
jgi:AcrR family transcriptional regulator